MAVNIPIPEATRPIVLDDMSMHDVFREWTRLITSEVNLSSLQSGSGSPEGVLEAKDGTLYKDNNGTAGNILYVKNIDDVAGDKTMGWILT